MAGETALPGWPSNFGELTPLCAPDVLHVGISHASKSASASREHYAAVLLAWDKYGARGAIVAWDSICQPLSNGGLGIRHLCHNNLALMCKWITQVMKPDDDILSYLFH